MNLFSFLVEFIKRKPAPDLVLALYLSLRWKCFVSLKTDIHYPFNIKIGKGTIIPGRCTLIASGNGINIGKGVELHEGAYLHCQSGSISVGNNTSIGPYVVMYGGGNITIGPMCGIASHTSIVSTSHVFDRNDIPIRLQCDKMEAVNIDEDVWIGTHCVITMGVNIAKGAVIGAGTVVLKSVESGSVVVGVPGRVIRKR
jgi:acetyltransferase-like isoleucine patch superfamily enzyme